MLFTDFGSRFARIGLFLCVPACAYNRSTCEEVESVALADDEESPAGATGAQVLDLASQTADVTLVWAEGVTNAQGETVLSLAFERTSSSVRFVRTKQTGTAKSDLGCGPDLFVPVLVRIRTEDGALDEAVETEAVYRTDDGPVTASSVATLSFDFDLDELTGWLATVPSWENGEGEFEATLGSAPRGNIGVAVEQDAKERYAVIASWGAPP